MATPTEELVAEETRRRPPVAAVAALAGTCFLVSGVLQLQALSDQPDIRVVDALSERFAGGEPQLKVQQTLFYDEKGVELLLAALLIAVAAAGTGYVLAFLFRATKAREPAMPRIGIIATVVGAVCMAVGSAVAGVVLFLEAGSFADIASPTVDDAEDVTESAALLAATAINKVVGVLALALGLFFVCFNAMKVGLLTRFMGILGMIAGAMFVLPFLAGGLPILQGIWLLFMSAVLLGTAFYGLPPAWETGRAVPWPSQQQLREQKQGRAERGGSFIADEPPRKRARFMPKPSSEPEPVALEKPKTAPKPHTSSKKRKKKRRA